MFLIQKAISSKLNDIVDNEIITGFDPYWSASLDRPERTTYGEIKECLDNTYIATDSDTNKLIGMIAGKHEVFSAGNDTYIDGYRVSMLLFDEASLSIYDKISCYNMAKQLVRSFCVDKNKYILFMEYDNRDSDTDLNEYVIAGLKGNDFYAAVNAEDGKYYYLRSPVTTKFKGFYN